MKVSCMNVAALLMTMAVAVGGDGQLALADRLTYPPHQQPYLYYVTTDPLDSDEARESAMTAMRLVLPSVSRQRNLEYCRPVPVQGSNTLYRIDLLALGWDLKHWLPMVARYPYSPTGSKNSIVLRADWLLIQLTDCQESSAYYDLLFGGKPKTRNEAFQRLGINAKASFSQGLVEGQSGVSVSGKRRLSNFPSNQRGTAWLTEDSLATTPNSDPIEYPQGGGKHDGEECIFQIPKLTKDGTPCYLQGYFLANGQGVIVDRAPVDLVVDHLQARKGISEIRNGIGCMVCHPRGLNFPTEDEYREYLESGVELYADYKTKELIDGFFIKVVPQMKRDNEDFAIAVEAACHVEPVVAASSLHAAVYRYDEELTLERCAHEVYMEPAEFELAISQANVNGYKLGARISGLAHKQDITRDSWEDQYFTVRQYAEYWRSLP